MNYQDLKDEGLKIVDAEGFPYESEAQNEEAWNQAIHQMPEEIDGDNEDLADYYAMCARDSAILEHKYNQLHS